MADLQTIARGLNTSATTRKEWLFLAVAGAILTHGALWLIGSRATIGDLASYLIVIAFAYATCPNTDKRSDT